MPGRAAARASPRLADPQALSPSARWPHRPADRAARCSGSLRNASSSASRAASRRAASISKSGVRCGRSSPAASSSPAVWTSRSRTAPRAAPSQPSSSASAAAQSWSTRDSNVRRSLRSRRAATRIWCTDSASPRRVPGSCCTSRIPPAAMAAWTARPAESVGPASMGMKSGGAAARGPIARTAFGTGSERTAPASWRRSAIGISWSSSGPRLSSSSSRNGRAPRPHRGRRPRHRRGRKLPLAASAQ